MPKIITWIDTGFAGAKHRAETEVPDAQWEHMTASERDECLEELAAEYLGNRISYGAYIADEGEPK